MPVTMKSDSGRRTFWQTYTFRNIKDEIKSRIAAFTTPSTRTDRQSITGTYDDTHARGVGHFYDTHHYDFLNVYGEVIQAFRTKNIADLLNYQISSIGFRPGQRVLDAGCGIGTPAIYFATHAGVHVDAITISKMQHEAACAKVTIANLADKVRVVLGDYHNLQTCFEPSAYDVVYFLESFGHSSAKRRLLESCWEVLKPGGILYIKDLFKRIPLKPEHKPKIDQEISSINKAYHYEVADLNSVLDDLRGRGFILASLKTIDLDLEQFEDLAISNKFQELTGLARIENWDEYVFPVDFFELKCVKPEFSLEERIDRYFLQNLYHRAGNSQKISA